MNARLSIIAAAAVALATAATAQSAKTPPAQANSAPKHPAPVVLASADHLAGPAPVSEATTAPAKPHRAARVTTCRCGGDPQPAPQDDQQ